MDVELYVYDLSRGMARQYSMALTGVQIDAIYHTAIVLNGVEYFFGQGIHRKIPGSTHHGRPMNIVKLGQTQLPMDVIDEYIQSLETIYTPESYDLFLHNCNNFSQDVSMFLVGKDIPDEIRSLPETFLKTPLGQMLRGQLDQSMRQMTQAPDAVSGRDAPRFKQPAPSAIPKQTASNGAVAAQAKMGPVRITNAIEPTFVPGHVHNITSTTELDRLLRSATATCAVIFFTSATCPPCKIVYPAYDQLAEEAGDKAVLIKVDTSKAYDVASRYQIRATPTFVTFLRGKKDDEWSGADEARLRGNVRLLISMAHPQHAHTRLRLPSFQSKVERPIMYTRAPPLDKLLAKIGPSAQDGAVQDLTNYLRTREKEGLESAAIPNMHEFSSWLTTKLPQIPAETHFAIIDLVRISASDPRISSYLTTEPNHSTLNLLIPPTKSYTDVPYSLQAVTLQLACNLFSSTIFQDCLLDPTSPLKATLDNLASTSLLSPHHNARSLSAALVYNLTAHSHNERILGRPETEAPISPDLEAALVQAVVDESENKETLRSLLLALGLSLYGVSEPNDSAVWELCSIMDVRGSLKQKVTIEALKGEKALIREVGEELLGKGMGA